MRPKWRRKKNRTQASIAVPVWRGSAAWLGMTAATLAASPVKARGFGTTAVLAKGGRLLKTEAVTTAHTCLHLSDEGVLSIAAGCSGSQLRGRDAIR